MYYTYLLRWSKQDKSYYGVRYKDSASLEDLCITYFSSSKYVKEFIKVNGLPDIICVRKIFNSKIDAKKWEEKVIRRLNATKRENWLNKGNANSFRSIVMTNEIRHAISKANKGRLTGYTTWNDGKINVRLSPTQAPPEGFKKGKLLSEKDKCRIENLNKNLTKEKRELAGQKASQKTKGIKKPIGFGEKISNATKGRPKPWQQGNNNVSKREDVRKKISESWKNRLPVYWYTNGIDNIRLNSSQTPSEGYIRGRTISTKK